jgi:AraC-like DNA-binding protein
MSPVALEMRSRSAFRLDPLGGLVAGECWFYFALDMSLFGYALWGRPSRRDVEALVRLMELELDRAPHVVLADLGGVTAVTPDAFEALASYAMRHESELSRVVTHAAIVRPSGVAGAIVSGFFDVSARPFPVTVWPSLHAALLHLGRPSAHGALVEARARVSGEPVIVRQLRDHLRETRAEPSLGAAARTLGLAPRTLQRRLAQCDSSFQAEVRRSRLLAAERRLEETDAPVTTIALDLGFSTPQHFATLFRRHAGVSPTEYRKRCAPR